MNGNKAFSKVLDVEVRTGKERLRKAVFESKGYSGIRSSLPKTARW